MSEHGVDNQQRFRNQNHKESDVENMLQMRIVHVLHDQAEHIHLTPSFREHIMEHIRPRPRHIFAFTPTFVVAVAIVILLSMSTYLFYPILTPHSTQSASTHYQVATSLDTPNELAHGGKLISLDPTEQHFVYQNVHEPGVMYTANLNDPSATNVLAMRYAYDATWSPDGTALVTTIYPAGAISPLLALIHTGQYMDTLGHAALAVSWSPTSKQEIVFVTQKNGDTQLWSTTPIKGQTPILLTTVQLPSSSLVQRLLWSPDGTKLALITTLGQKPSPQLLDQPGNAIYIMDVQAKNVHALPFAKDAAIGDAQWSPNGQFLSYEQPTGQNHSTLHAINIITQHEAFTISSQHTLLGWNWSPDSNALIYSDGGTLSVRVLHGSQVVFPHTNAAYPLWLHDGRILTLNQSNGTGKLEVFARTQ